MTRVPSIGVSSPSLTAERTLLAALEASMASFISGKGKDTDLSLGGGVTYDAGVSRNTVGAEKVCMNILPMPPGVKSKPHIHRGIETIAYMLEGECTLFHGEQLENQTLIKQGEQIFIPDNVPHAPYNLSDKKCVWVVVHSSGDDQDELVRTTELDYILENFGG